MNTQKFDVIIIGGGAGGLFLASQLPPTLKVAILESNDRVGKKLLATGNGKCNLTNLDMNIVHYNKPSFVESFLDRFDAHDTISTFEKAGLITKVIDKRVYPYSESAATVLDVLRRAVERNGVQVLTSHFANFIEQFNDVFNVSGVVKNDDKPNQSFSYT
ncbi:MAG TPA: aminoacetone oxidase family FAD-binding enzyme, partial [Clostridiales bacterium]|nr:aminoacetone oxidase family FAD-binding enzyme [Clostridiales bacterium]